MDHVSVFTILRKLKSKLNFLGLFLVPLEYWASLVAQMVKNLPAMQETWVWSLGLEDPLEKEKATDSSTLAWRIAWTEEPGGLQSMGLQRVRRDWATEPAWACSSRCLDLFSTLPSVPSTSHSPHNLLECKSGPVFLPRIHKTFLEGQNQLNYLLIV